MRAVARQVNCGRRMEMLGMLGRIGTKRRLRSARPLNLKTARSALAVVCLLIVPAVALGDNPVSDGDGVVPYADSDMAFDSVSCGAPSDKTARVSISRQGTVNPNTFANSSNVTISVLSVSGSGLSATPVGSQVITLPANWTTLSSGALSAAVTTTVTINSSTPGPGSGTVTYRASGVNALSGTALTRTDTMNVTWDTGPCGPTDTTPPSITPDVQGTLGNNGWYTSDVTVTWTVTDPDSTISSQTGCGPTTISANTAGTTLTCSATSAGGTSSESVTIKRDATAPAIVRDAAADSCSLPGTNGWCRGTQTAGFSASDAPSGLLNGESSPWAFTKSTSTNGAAVTISSGSLDDNAGNTSGVVGAGPYKIDSVQPLISGAATPAPNGAGWNSTDVDVDFTCSDTGGSGVALCGPDDTLTTEGRNQSVSGTATDAAGNSASATVGGIDIDRSAPSSPAASTTPASPVAGSGDWFKDTVTVAYGGSTDPDLADSAAGSGVSGYSANQTFSASGTHPYSGTATDSADNESAATTGNVKVDATMPLVSISGCPTGPVILGSAQSITVAASDAHSGLVSDPSGSAALDTSTVGAGKTKTVAVEDKVGHTASATCTYGVIYNWNGFFQPIDNDILNSVQAGRTVPAKFSLGGNQGLNILSTGSPSPPSSQSFAIACTSSLPVDGIEESTTAVAGLKYDALADQYIYNWATQKAYAGTCRRFILTLADGTQHIALFKFTK